jgi:hypothetical protein
MPERGFLYRINPDGTRLQKLLTNQMTFLYGLSADGKWAALWKVVLAPLGGGEPIELCEACGTVGAENRGVTPPVISWARDGKYLYLHSAWLTRETFAVPLGEGRRGQMEASAAWRISPSCPVHSGSRSCERSWATTHLFMSLCAPCRSATLTASRYPEKGCRQICATVL